MKKNIEKIDLDNPPKIIDRKDNFYIVNIRKVKKDDYKYYLKRKEEIAEII